MSTQRSLSAAIAAQEQAVQDADKRLAERLAAVTSRMRSSRSPLRSVGLTLTSLAAAWVFLRAGRGLVARAGTGANRLSLLLNATLPLLLPVIGARAAAVLTALAAAPAKTSAPQPAVAPLIDLTCYAGTWYEIGRITSRNDQLSDDVTATYLPPRAGLRVIDRRRRADGRGDVVRGRARVVDPVSQAKLKITFAPAGLRWLPIFWTDYWILDVTPDYSRALVGTPDRRSLRILARKASIPASDYHTMLLHAAAQGYDTARMRMTVHHCLA